jgi:hypothetical protein
LLEDGKFRSAGEITEAEKVTRSFVNRLLRLTLLAPEIVEAILERKQLKAMQLEKLTGAIPRSSGRLFCQAPPKRVEVGRFAMRRHADDCKSDACSSAVWRVKRTRPARCVVTEAEFSVNEARDRDP